MENFNVNDDTEELKGLDFFGLQMSIHQDYYKRYALVKEFWVDFDTNFTAAYALYSKELEDKEKLEKKFSGLVAGIDFKN